MVKKLNTFDTIIVTATEVFAEAGFAGARMDEIAKRAGVNKATIYYNIGNKEALYNRVLIETFGKRINQVEKLLEGVDSPEEKLDMYIKNIADTIETYPNIPRIIMWEHASGGKHFTEEIAEQIARMINTLTAILDSGNNDGVFRKTNPLLIQFMLMGSMLLYKTSAPIRNRFDSFPVLAKQLPEAVSGPIAEELSKLIIHALKR